VATYQPTLSAAGSCQVWKLISDRDSNGTTKATIAQEIVSAAAMVMASVLEKAPVTPDRNTSGMNTIIVARLDPVSGRHELLPGREDGVASDRMSS